MLRWRGLWPRWRRAIRGKGCKAWPLLPRWSSQTRQFVHQRGLTQVLSGPAPLNRIQLGTLVKTRLPSTPCPRSKGSEEEAHRALATHTRRLVKDRKRQIFPNLRWRWNAVFLWSSRLDYHRCQGEVISWLNNSERLRLFSFHNCCRLVVCVYVDQIIPELVSFTAKYIIKLIGAQWPVLVRDNFSVFLTRSW